MLFKKLVVTFVFTLGTLVAAQATVAEMMDDTTRIVVYRGDDSVRTERLAFDVHVGNQDLGELEQRESVTSLELPGQTVISANVAGAKDIVVNAKPGHTHYVRMDVKLRGTSLKISFTEVEEQVAQVEKPELFSAI